MQQSVHLLTHACGSHQSFLYGPQWAQHSVIPHCGDFSRYDASQIPVAMWHAGGNWGSLYPINARRWFKDNIDFSTFMFLNQLDRLLTFYSLLERNITILQMPQSLYYSPEAISLGLDIKEADIIKHAIESTVGLSRGKTKVILTWREESSFFVHKNYIHLSTIGLYLISPSWSAHSFWQGHGELFRKFWHLVFAKARWWIHNYVWDIRNRCSLRISTWYQVCRTRVVWRIDACNSSVLVL
jgi:hypothetical protein